MDKAIIGKKLGMSQIFTADGKVIPVTVVEAGPCTVVQIKTKENDGYDAVQVGFGAIKETRVNKPVAGHFKKAGVTVKRYLRELRLANCAAYELGQELTCDVFAEGDKVDVKITDVDMENKKVSLSIRALLEEGPADEEPAEDEE